MPILILTSQCGNVFDDYVKQAIGSWVADCPESRTVGDLWHGRRLKIHQGGEWKEGRVRSWTQTVISPDGYSQWSLELELVDDGTDEDNPGKRRKVVTSSGEQTHSEHEERTANEALKFEVNRMNVEGGGTLKTVSDESSTELISLEWMQPAVPALDLNQDVLSYRCPFCRAVEPVVAAHEDPSQQKRKECPICLDTLECRVLQCGHGVCESCWASYRRATMIGSVELEDLDHELIEKERTERHRQCLMIRPARELFQALRLYAATFEDIVMDASSGKKGLTRFYQELMVEHPLFWGSFTRRMQSCYDVLPEVGLKIFLSVFIDRKDEYISATATARPGSNDAEETFYAICEHIVNRMQNEISDYHSIIPWLELGLYYHSKHCSCKVGPASRLFFLGEYQRKIGLLVEALGSYDSCLELQPNGERSDGAREGREVVLVEMKEWTGTSGNLSPGC